MKKELTIKGKSILFILGISFFSFLAATFFPFTLDEAYYYVWGKNLAFGYLDHPPMLALLPTLSLPWPRLGAFVLGLGSLVLAARFYRAAGLRSWQTWLVSLILFKMNLAGLANGIIIGPDCFLTFFWLLALHEALLALQGRRKRWLSAGLATGLGLLSKYTMVLISPIFLYALLRRDPKALKTRWPYLGALVALLTFSPNLFWNFQHDWLGFKFQLRRISGIELPQVPSDLPTPKLMQKTGPEWELVEKIQKKEHALAEARKKEEKKRPLDPFFQSLAWTRTTMLMDFIGGQLALWGFLIFAIFFVKKRKGNTNPLSPQARSLVFASLWIPLLFFAAISFKTKVEPNWPALYLVGAAPLLAIRMDHSLRQIVYAGLGNCIFLLLLTIQANTPFLFFKNDRILKETFGFELLAKHVENLPEPLFADTYQTVSMLRFYDSEKTFLQWPGISRPSEYTHNPIFSYSFENLKTQKTFWLITTDDIPPTIPSFEPKYMEHIEDCKEGGLLIRSSDLLIIDTIPTPCHSVHQWSLIRYEAYTKS